MLPADHAPPPRGAGRCAIPSLASHVSHLMSGEQIISPTTTAQDVQDGSSLFGEVGELLRAVHAQEMHRLRIAGTPTSTVHWAQGLSPSPCQPQSILTLW